MSYNKAVIEEGIKSINESAFERQPVEEVRLPSGIEMIPWHAFNGCTLLKNIVIPDSVKEIGVYAFAFSGLTNIVIPDRVTKIGNGAFFYCGFLTSIVISDSVKEIGNIVFDHCGKLTNIIIPAGVTRIGERAFNGSGLKTAVIPDGVTEIEEGLFAYCSSLKTAVIPKSAAIFGDYIFKECSPDLKIIFCGTKCEWYSILEKIYMNNNIELFKAKTEFRPENRETEKQQI